MKISKKVVVAMSGGIDSSVTAALLKRAGFDVIGVLMKFWLASGKNGLVRTRNRCCSPAAELRARKVANFLKIPFYVFNFEKEFKKRIVDYFLEGYKKGITPNPCVVCNKEIKFGLLLEKALALGCDFMATGHYARLRREIPNPKISLQGVQQCSQIPKIKLLRAKDKNKDQSYFLWMLNQEQLKRILFPIGDYTKDEVRNLAKKFKLPVLNIPESMEICFIINTVEDFLREQLGTKPGKIVDKEGKAIGEHQGLYFYTIGQRKGIKLPGGPYYVLEKNRRENQLVITKNIKDLNKKDLIAKDVNWILGEEPNLPLKIKAKIRYRCTPASAVITKKLENRIYKLIFEKAQRAITPGQSVVFYLGQGVLGGGVICSRCDL